MYGLKNNFPKTVPLSETGRILSGGTPDTNKKEYWNGEIMWCTPTDLSKIKDRFLFTTQRKITKLGLESSSASILPTGSLLVCTRASVGDLAISRIELATNQGFKNIIPHPRYDINFLYYYLAFSKPLFLRLSSGSTFLELSKTEFSKILIPDLILSEQKKIAEILGASDEAIEAQQKLIELKEKRLKGWMQKLLTGKVRFPQFADKPWQEIRAQELFTTRSLKNKEGLPVLSVTQDEGVVLRDDLDRKISGAASNFPNYKVILPGDFVISLRSFQGGLEYSRLKGAVSPAYHVLYKKCELYDEFYRLFFKSWEFVGRLSIATIGIRDGKQISFKDFSFMKVPSPTLQEQEKVASFLCELESELVIEKDKLSQLILQKKSLMQKLLTGKVRVKVDGVVEDSR